jgi:Flp pilus assembly protein TadD
VFLTGVALERTGKFADAAERYRAALAISPKDFEYHFAMGRVSLRGGSASEAGTRRDTSWALR